MLCLRRTSYTVLQAIFTGENMIVNTLWSVSIKSMFHMVFSLKLAYILEFRNCLLMLCLSKIKNGVRSGGGG